MSIIVNVDVMMAKRKMSSQELAEKIGITQANLSILKTGKAKAIRFSDGQGQGHPLLDAGGYLQGVGLSARGYSGVYGVGGQARWMPSSLMVMRWRL